MNKTPSEVAPLIAKVYEFSPVGGNGHIVFDDENVEDEHVRWCLDVALKENYHKAGPKQLQAEREALEALLPLSEDDRLKAVELASMLIGW